MRSSSIQPPETEPTVSPLSLMAMSEPGGRGEEPQVRATVTSTAGKPASCHLSAARRTRVSRSSMAGRLSIADAGRILACPAKQGCCHGSRHPDGIHVTVHLRRHNRAVEKQNKLLRQGRSV